MKFLLKASIGFAVVFLVGSAFAQTDLIKHPAFWVWSLGNCGSETRKFYESCQAGWNDVTAKVAACPNTTLTTGNPCSSTNPAAGNGTTIFTVAPGGSNQPTGTIGINCKSGPNFETEPGTGELVCSQGQYSFYALQGDQPCPNCPKRGNPFYPGSGNKYQTEVDHVGSGPFPLTLVRYFNSLALNQNDNIAGFGPKWTHSYFRRLVFSSFFNAHRVSALRPDGKAIAFIETNGIYVSDPGFKERLQRSGTGWTLTTLSDETELYDSTGRLVSITNRLGLTQTLAYGTDGRLQSVTDPIGHTLTFTRNSVGVITSINVQPENRAYTYTYTNDATVAWLLNGVTYPDLNARGYIYDVSLQNYQLSGIRDENGVRYATFEYNGLGFAIGSFHAGNADLVEISTFNNASQGPRSQPVTDFMGGGLNATRTYVYQPISGLAVNTAIQGPPCPQCGAAAQTFDNNANITSSTDWNGNRTNFGYDLARNLETSRTEGLTAVGGTTPQTRTITTEWHPSFRLVKRQSEPLRITTYVYNGDGGASCGMQADGTTLVPEVLCSKTIQATTDANGSAGFGATASGTPRTWTYTYNANGQVLTVDGTRTDVSDVTTYTYYANNDVDVGKRGNLATTTNAAGQTTSITAYNADGRPLTIVDPNGLTTTLTYDARQRLTSRSVGGETTTYDYDNAGQLTKVTLPDTSFLSYGYDDAHRLTSMQDNLGNKISYTLDLKGNRLQEKVFDPGNTLVQTRSRVYSNINRLFQELGALGQTTEYGYDNQGNVASVKDPNNNTSTNQYDALNRLKQVTDPGLGVTQYAYNGLDALTQVTDPRSLVTGYTVDGLGNLNQQSSPDTGNTVNTYDTAGNLLAQTDAKGQVTTYTYDALNRVTLITFHDGSKQTYAYDQGTNGIGRLSSITETNPSNVVTSVIAYAYDQHGRVTSETRTVNSVQYVLGYSYDASGRLSGMTYPSGRSIAYTFDALGRVNQVNTTADGQQQVVVQNVAYQPFGVVKSFTLGNGQIYSRTVDQDGRIASYTLGNANYQLTYDPASRITGISEVGNPSNANTYGYDALDRLISAVLPSSSFGYAYDSVGNRTTKTTGANTDTYTYSPSSNRIATLTPSGSPIRTFVFDANGSTTDDGANTYAYDTRGRMVQATNASSLVTSYQVNARGERIRKTNANDDRVFLYDTRGKLIAETDPGGILKRELIYLGDIPVGVVQ